MEKPKRSPEEELPMTLPGQGSLLEEEEDDGLILWMLGMSPTERLEFAQGFIDSIQVLKNGRRA